MLVQKHKLLGSIQKPKVNAFFLLLLQTTGKIPVRRLLQQYGYKVNSATNEKEET